MCVLKAFSNSRSFKAFSETTEIPVYSCADKGDVLNPKSKTLLNEYRISFDVSDKDWDDFPGQAEDAIAFLSKWEAKLALRMTIQSSSTNELAAFPGRQALLTNPCQSLFGLRGGHSVMHSNGGRLTA